MLRRDLYDEMAHILTSGQSNRTISYVRDHLFFDNTSSMVYNFREHMPSLECESQSSFPFRKYFVFFVLFI